MTPSSPQPKSARIFWLVSFGVVLYLFLDVLAQSLPPHYNPINTAESDLAVGPYGYIMTINFVNRGLLSLAFLYAFTVNLRLAGEDFPTYRRSVYLLGVWGVGALLLAAFPTDVPATPISWHGAIHLAVAFLAFLGGTLGALDLSLRFRSVPSRRGIATFALAIAAIGLISLVLLFGLPFITPQLASRIGGVTERLLIGSVLVWILMLSLYLGRTQTRGTVPHDPGKL